MAFRKLKYNNGNYYFNFSAFKDLFAKKHDKDKIKIGKLEEDMANEINVTREAVHNWRFTKNGPADIDLVKKIANYFNLTSLDILLTKKKGVDNKMLNDLQIKSIKKVYDSIIDFLEVFNNTNGFNDLWFEIKEKPEFREDELYEIATREHDKVMLYLKKEYFYLKGTKIYTDLENYIYNNLYEVYEGKLSYGYRFEAEGEEHGTPTLSEDYNKAINTINIIIDEYL